MTALQAQQQLTPVGAQHQARKGTRLDSTGEVLQWAWSFGQLSYCHSAEKGEALAEATLCQYNEAHWAGVGEGSARTRDQSG